ncbi:MAG: hypothetical protein ACJ70Z_08790 [Nitrososphaera sp.]
MANPNTARTKEYNKSIGIISRTNTKSNIGKYDYITPYIIEHLQGITFHHNRSLIGLSSIIKMFGGEQFSNVVSPNTNSSQQGRQQQQITLSSSRVCDKPFWTWKLKIK